MYQPRHIRRRKGRTWLRHAAWFGLSLLVLAMGFGGGLLFARPDLAKDSLPLAGAQLSGWLSALQRPATSEPPLIAPETVIQRDTEFVACKQVVSESENAPPEWLGMTQADLQARYPDWTIVSFTARKVELRTRAPGCPYHGRTLLLQDGRVGIYYGTPTNLGPLARETGVLSSQLSPVDRQRLENGIVAADEAEAERILANLTGR